MIDFSDMTGGEVTAVEAESRINEVDNHLREVSYDQFGFGTKDVVPTVLRMPQTAAYYQAIPDGNTGADGHRLRCCRLELPDSRQQSVACVGLLELRLWCQNRIGHRKLLSNDCRLR